MAFRRRTWLGVIAVALVMGGGLRAFYDLPPEDLSSEWMPLLQRCKDAIENSKPLDTEGLSPVETSKVVHKEFVGSSDRSRIVGAPGGRFLIVETEKGPPLATSRSCDVALNPKAKALSVGQVSRMLNSFVEEQITITKQNRTPKIISIFPYVMIRADAPTKNPSACNTTTVFLYNPSAEVSQERGPLLAKFTVGEQNVVSQCKGVSRLIDAAKL